MLSGPGVEVQILFKKEKPFSVFSGDLPFVVVVCVGVSDLFVFVGDRGWSRQP